MLEKVPFVQQPELALNPIIDLAYDMECQNFLNLRLLLRKEKEEQKELDLAAFEQSRVQREQEVATSQDAIDNKRRNKRSQRKRRKKKNKNLGPDGSLESLESLDGSIESIDESLDSIDGEHVHSVELSVDNRSTGSAQELLDRDGLTNDDDENDLRDEDYENNNENDSHKEAENNTKDTSNDLSDIRGHIEISNDNENSCTDDKDVRDDHSKGGHRAHAEESTSEEHANSCRSSGNRNDDNDKDTESANITGQSESHSVVHNLEGENQEGRNKVGDTVEEDNEKEDNAKDDKEKEDKEEEDKEEEDKVEEDNENDDKEKEDKEEEDKEEEDKEEEGDAVEDAPPLLPMTSSFFRAQERLRQMETEKRLAGIPPDGIDFTHFILILNEFSPKASASSKTSCKFPPHAVV